MRRRLIAGTMSTEASRTFDWSAAQWVSGSHRTGRVRVAAVPGSDAWGCHAQLACGSFQFVARSISTLYDLLRFMKGPDTSTPFPLQTGCGLGMSLAFDAEYFDRFHVRVVSGGSFLSLVIDVDDRLDFVLGLEQALLAA